MTRGEKVAWIWVWSAITVLIGGLSFAAWLYGPLLLVYGDVHSCEDTDTAIAVPACERVLANSFASPDMRFSAYLRLATVAANAGRHDDAIRHLSDLIAAGLATSTSLNDRGIAYYKTGRFKAAVDDFRAAIRMDDDVAYYWSNLADAQLELKDYKAALPSYDQAIHLGDDTADILGNRGWALYQLDRFKEALEDYDKALAKTPKHFDNLNERGLVRHELGDHRAALADFDRALELSVNNAVVLTNRSASYSRLGDMSKARADLDLALLVDPEYVPARIDRAWLFLDLRQPEDALSDLAYFTEPTSFDLRIFQARAQAHADLKQWPAAIASADKAVALGSRAPWLYQTRADARYESGDYEGAIADATTALAANPTHSAALMTRAFAFIVKGQLDSAMADMDLLVKTASDRAYALETRSYINLSRGRLDAALSDASEAARLAPASPHSAAALGRMLAETGDGAAALSECNRALAIAESAFALQCRAFAYLVLERHAPALLDIRRALEINAASSNGHVLFGRIELALGDAPGAIGRFDRAIALEIYDGAGVYMYRGDAERALGNLDQARLDYRAAQDRDLGLYAGALADRLRAIPGP